MQKLNDKQLDIFFGGNPHLIVDWLNVMRRVFLMDECKPALRLLLAPMIQAGEINKADIKNMADAFVEWLDCMNESLLNEGK